MSFNRRTGVDPEVYYHRPIEYLKKCKKEKKEITRDDLVNVIVKHLNVRHTDKVIKRLKELGWIAIEEKKIIKVLK